jgi:tryptophan synthase alpha chain
VITRTTTAFERAREAERAALVGYLPAGFPSVSGAISAIHAMIDSGVDVVEIGYPYSDPVMDGPVIQRATEAALAAGMRLKDLFHTVEAVSGAGVPILVMTYWNPVERYGTARFARDLAAAGGAGMITPDLIPDEADEWIAAADEQQLDRVFLVAPSSTEERLAMTADACRGFVYAASTMGVTGERTIVSDAAPTLVKRVRATCDIPVAVGLGVGNGEQAARVAQYADGVIVGSALVRCVMADEDSSFRSLRELTAQLARGVRGQLS